MVEKGVGPWVWQPGMTREGFKNCKEYAVVMEWDCHGEVLR